MAFTRRLILCEGMIALAAVTLLLAYVLGSVPVGYLVGRLHGTDVRDHGSGNIGTTNILRLFGAKWAVIVLLLDAGKGYLACALAGWMGVAPEYVALAGVAVIAGHNWSVFLGFAGGKGAATTAGVFSYLTPVALGIGLSVSILFWLVTRYMSLGVILGVFVGTLWANLFSTYPTPYNLATLVALIWILIRHRENIRRLLRGEERRLGQREEYREGDGDGR